MKVREKLLKRTLSGIVAVMIVMSMFPLLASAVESPYLVKFKDAEDGTVAFTRIVEANEPITEPADDELMSFDPPADRVVTGWYKEDDPSKTPVTFGSFTAEGKDLTLVPVYSNLSTAYVFFIAEGTATEVKMVSSGSTVAKPTDPSRAGYTFEFWSQDGTNEFDFSTPITEHTELRAVWTPVGEANYMLKFYMEKANMPQDGTPGNMDEYEFLQSVQMTGAVGTTPNITASTLADFDLKKYFVGQVSSSKLKYTEFQSADIKEISGDGTTIINVFVKRKTYVFNYNLGTTAGNSMTIDGNTYYSGTGQEVYAKSAKYGNFLAGPNIETEYHPAQEGYKATSWLVSTSGGSSYLIIRSNTTAAADLLSSNGQTSSYTWTASWALANVANPVRIWLEPLPEDEADSSKYFLSVPADQSTINTSIRGKTFYHASQYDWTYYTNLFVSRGGFNMRPVEGFTALDARDNAARNQNMYQDESDFYYVSTAGAYPVQSYFYSRNSYTLQFDLQVDDIGDVTNAPTNQYIKYDKPLTDLEPAEPVREGYEFLGWYTDLDDEAPYDFETGHMPASNLILHAKWEEIKEEYTVTFYDYYGGNVLDVQTVYAGDLSVDNLNYVEGESYALGTFGGWRYNLVSETSSSFLFEVPVYFNLDVYGSWNPGAFTVTYDIGAGTGSTPTDSDRYMPGTTARVASGSALTGAAKAPFIGWTDQDGIEYSADDFALIEKDVVLTAQYGEPVPTYSVIYDPGTGTGTAYTVSDIAGGEEHQTFGVNHHQLGYTKNGYTFIGWSYSDELGGAKAGLLQQDNVFAMPAGNVTLTALYEKLPAATTPGSTTQTGDNSNIVLWLTLAGISLFSLLILVVVVKRRRQHDTRD